MRDRLSSRLFIARITPSACTLVAIFAWLAPNATAQNPQLQEHMAQIKQAMSLNKQVLAQYTWQEQQTVSIKGEVKKQELYQVQLGPDGKPQKTALDPEEASSGGRKHGIKHRVVEKKKEEFEDYAKEIATLAQSYVQPDPGKLQQLYDQGNVMLGSAGAPNEIRIVIQNYSKQGDTVTIIFNKEQQAIQSLQISSYLDDPKDAVKISAQFAQLPNGPNHVSNVVVNGVSKELTVQMQNSNYQKL
jgi:hypothetical protein